MGLTAGRSTPTAVDRWFHPALALLFLITAVAGFGPNSVGVLTGRLESPPLLVHVHAAVMTGWLLLLLTQPLLVATGNRRRHRQLGLATIALVPMMVATMVMLAIPTLAAGPHSSAIAVVQARRLLLFAGFFGWALRARRTDPTTHRRAMFWATVVLLDAAFFRMGWLPTLGTDNLAIPQMYQLALMAPAMAFDLWKLGTIHRVHVVGFALMLATTIVAGVLW